MEFASLVYLLSLATSAVCAALLTRAYWRTQTRLLLWSALCFALLALNNMFVVFDIVLFPNIDFGLMRNLSSLIGISILLYGFIWETD